MYDTGADRLELECQILCSALRHSWSVQDLNGVINAAQQLSEFFPDLLITEKADESFHESESQTNHTLPNLYSFLNIDYRTSENKLKVIYRLILRKHLRTKRLSGKDFRLAFFELLDTGLVMKNQRLRLSHDLNVLRQTLVQHHLLYNDGSFTPIAQVGATAPVPKQEELEPIKHPPIIRLMLTEGMITEAEARAIYNQMKNFNKIKVHELLLSAGYLNMEQLISLQKRTLSLRNN